jgi:hypothetical protein
MNDMNITSAQYQTSGVTGENCIRATVDGKTILVPLTPGNRHYDEIQRQVAAGTLTIQDAD